MSKRNLLDLSPMKGKNYYGYTQIESIPKSIQRYNIKSTRNSEKVTPLKPPKDYLKFNMKTIDKPREVMEFSKPVNVSYGGIHYVSSTNITKVADVSDIYSKEIKRMEKAIDKLKGRIKEEKDGVAATNM